MFKSKLIRFVLRGIGICTILSMIGVLFTHNRFPLIGGLLCGALLASIRFLSNVYIYWKSIYVNSRNKIPPFVKTSLLFILNQIVLIALLYIFHTENQWLFIGLIVGLLFAPLIIIINSITEVIGITKNKFYLN